MILLFVENIQISPFALQPSQLYWRGTQQGMSRPTVFQLLYPFGPNGGIWVRLAVQNCCSVPALSTLYPCCPTKQLNMLIGTSYWRGLHWFHVEKYAGLHVQNVQLRSVRWVNNKVQNTSHVHIKSRSLSPIYYYKNSVWMLQAEAIHMWYHKS